MTANEGHDMRDMKHKSGDIEQEFSDRKQEWTSNINAQKFSYIV